MEIKIPEVGESVFEALLARWIIKDGDRVKKDEPLCEIETDKITFEINAEVDGVVRVTVAEGTTVKIGTVIGSIDEAAQPDIPVAPTKEPGSVPIPPPISPAVRKIAREQGLEPESIAGSGKGGRVTMDDLYGRITKGSGVTTVAADTNPPAPAAVRSEEPEAYLATTDGRVTRKTMTPIRKRIAERLLAARQQTAMLTTFNEADMSRVVALRGKHRDDFRKRHGVSLGFMSFFVKAVVEALREFPLLNARIDGDEIVYQHFYDIGIAVSGEKGLVVPVLRDAEQLGFAAIEKAITDFVDRVKTNRLAIADLEGGTFTISNGGIFGSLLSTPIINPPQSAVLGMHAVQERPVARDGQVVIRPMMYLALSYDHRLIDGREAVQFLKRVKEFIEEPEELLLEG